MLFRYFLAHRLGLPLAAIEAMTVEEFTGWQAYFELITPKMGKAP